MTEQQSSSPDIVERLRNDGSSWAQELFNEAAFEIERLRRAARSSAAIVSSTVDAIALDFDTDPMASVIMARFDQSPMTIRRLMKSQSQ